MVRVLLPAPSVTTMLLDALRELMVTHPRLEVQLMVSQRSASAIPDADLAVLMGALPDRVGLVARRVVTVRWQFCAAPSYVQRRGVPLTPEALSEHECLRFRGDTVQDSWTLDGPNGARVTVPVHGAMESDDSRVLGDAIYAGLGIGIRSRRELAEAVAAGRLVHLLPAWEFSALPVYLAHPRGGTHRPGVRTVAEVLTRALAEME